MPDLGQPLEFGAFVTPDSADPQHAVTLAGLADVAGLDLFTAQDHPYQARQLDTWTLLSVIAASTTSIRLSTNVACLPLRPPVVLAKAAATLDVLSRGRVEMGLGAGAFWDAIVAAGGPRREPKQAVDALIEAIKIMRSFWAGGSVNEVGEHYQVKGLHAGPKPAHDIPIVLGAVGPRMLRVVGRMADGWVPSMAYVGPDKLTAMNKIIDEAALKAGRTPEQIRRWYNIAGRFGSGGGLLQGTPAQWAEQLANLALTEGMSTFVLSTDDPTDLQRYAAEVVPAVCELVEDARSTPSEEPVVKPVEVHAPAVDEARPMAVVPTPQQPPIGTLPWDESTRPTYPVPEGATYTAQQQGAPAHLKDVHDALRAELRQVRDIVDQVKAGHLEVGAARSQLNTMTMRQNNWTLGAYCESYCRLVTGHHLLEDRSFFRKLKALDPAVAPVIDRLSEEHVVIHDVLDQVDRALIDLVEDDGYGQQGRKTLDDLSTAVDLLTDTLLSHFAYEERELLHPLAEYGL